MNLKQEELLDLNPVQSLEKSYLVFLKKFLQKLTHLKNLS